MDLALSGLATGFDWQGVVEQLSEIERAPQRRLRTEQNLLERRNNAYGSIVTQLNVLQNRVDALTDADLFNSRTATSGDETVATATAAVGAALGAHTFSIIQLATTGRQQGLSNVGHRLSDSDDVSGVVLSEAAFATTVTAGTFTVNGRQITINTTDSLQDVLDQIATATGGAVQAGYSAVDDTITLTHQSGGEIILGSATDTSNFLQAAKLYNNGTDTVTSGSPLGSVRLHQALGSANLDTAISDGGAGAGEFKINGVSISFDAATDTVADVLARINNSGAGVSASYDVINDRFLLTNKVTGDVGIALEDVTGNFLAATGVTGGTLSHGRNLLYTVDRGGTLVSSSNTITETSSGLTGLSVSVVSEGSATIEVKADTDKIRTAITDFMDEYNRSQSMLAAETSTSTDEDGNVTAGVLAFQSEPNEVATSLRRAVNAVVSGLSGTVAQLAGLGITSNGNDDLLSLSDGAALDEALSENLENVRQLFADETNGIATKVASYLEHTAGEEGTLLTLQENLGKQIAEIDVQVADLERLVQANEEQLIRSFVAMEEAQARINQQMSFLAQRLGLQ